MSTTTGTLSRTEQHQLLGGLAMVGAVCYFIAGIVMLVTGKYELFVVNLFSVLWTFGCICGLLGIGALGATGTGLLGRLALGVALAAYALAAFDALLITVGVYAGLNSPLFALSRQATMVGMLLVGIAAVVARRWPGWRKFTPFALPLAVPVAIIFGVTTGIQSVVLFVGLAWLIIGYAISSTRTTLPGA